MKNKAIKLLSTVFLLMAHNNPSLAAMEFESFQPEDTPLVGRITMNYLKATSHQEDKPVTLTISVSPLLGGKSVDMPMELNETEIPDLIDLRYVQQIIDSTGALRIFLEELKSENFDQASIKVCLFFDGLASHREKINGFNVLNLRK